MADRSKVVRVIQVIGVMYGKSILANTKDNTFNSVVRPTMMFALEAGKTTEKHEMQLEVAELKMLRILLEVTKRGKIHNHLIRGRARVEKLDNKVREARLPWDGHVKTKNFIVFFKKFLNMGLPENCTEIDGSRDLSTVQCKWQGFTSRRR